MKKNKTCIVIAIRPTHPPVNLIIGQFSQGIEPAHNAYYIRNKKETT